ncbi:MAG: DUF1778 domain-containing protein [bacterium]|nr:DUF1778 domain-containing protein [bacterium]
MLVKEEKPTARTARFALRATPRQQMLIQRAAEVSNKSVTEFVLDSACAAAESTLLKQNLFFLKDDEIQNFLKILDRPAEVKPGLRELFLEKAPWE